MTDPEVKPTEIAAAKLEIAAKALDLAVSRNRIRGVGIELSIAQLRVAEARAALAGAS